MPYLRRVLLLLAVIALAACAHGTRITAPEAGTTLRVRDTQPGLLASHTLRGARFGNHEFEAETPGQPSFHAILPLSFKGGHRAVAALSVPRSSKRTVAIASGLFLRGGTAHGPSKHDTR